LEGLELENEGGGGSLGSHIERRMVPEDLMMSTSAMGLGFSKFLGLALEDSGWYKVNPKYYHVTTFGKGAGCGILSSKCVS
jgi:hypothetical protein